MAVTLNPTDPLYYAELFGISKDAIATAKMLGISIKNSLGTLTVHGPDGKTYGNITVKGSAITLAKANNLGPSSKAVIHANLSAAIAKAVTGAGGSMAAPPPIDTTSMTPGQKAALTKAQQKVEMVMPGYTAKPVVKLHQNPMAAEMAGHVKLSEATKLYEPVAGTSSVYYVVAVYADIKVAMRRTPGKLSLRCEGSALSKKMPSLQSLGFDHHDGYASTHLAVTDLVLLRKTVGALFGLLGYDGLAKLGDPALIEVSAS